MGIPFKLGDGSPSLDLGWNVMKLVPYTGYGKGMAIEEGYAVELLIRIANEGRLSLLQECRCGTWFVASNKVRVNCSDACKERSRESRKSYHRSKAKDAHERKRTRKLKKVNELLRQWKTQPPRLRKGHGWKHAVSQQLPEITKRFLTTAEARGDLIKPAFLKSF
jgi:hypothetical protein